MGKIGEPVKCANDGCDTIFIRKTSTEKYCCDECKKEAINRKRKEKRRAKSSFTPGINKCALCGQEFLQKSTRNIYCSRKCSRNASKKRIASEIIIRQKAKKQNHIMSKEIFARKLSNDLFWAQHK